MAIYLIHEENEHKEFSSMVIKHIDTDLEEATSFWKQYNVFYGTHVGYHLVLSKYVGHANENHDGSNILRQLETIKTTEKDDDSA